MRRLLIMFCVLGTLTACGTSTEPQGVISDEQFIEAISALRQASHAAGQDEAAFLAAREQILSAQSLTTDDLGAYLAAHSNDLERLARVWQAVNERVPDMEVH